jgi:uncharacterized protein
MSIRPAIGRWSQPTDAGGNVGALTVPSRCDQRLCADPYCLSTGSLPAQLNRKSRCRKWVYDLTTGSESIAAKSPEAASMCRSCGACCSFSRDWPRFTTEDDSDLDLIPRALADHHLGRMKCDGDRCTALVGEVGVSTSCAVYSVRPEVCRACEPGDEACQLARHRFAL